LALFFSLLLSVNAFAFSIYSSGYALLNNLTPDLLSNFIDLVGDGSTSGEFSFSPSIAIESGDSINIAFSGLSATGVLVSDVDLLINGNQRALASSCGAGIDFSFVNTDIPPLMTLVSCGTVILPGDDVRILVGRNTTFQAQGVNNLFITATLDDFFYENAGFLTVVVYTMDDNIIPVEVGFFYVPLPFGAGANNNIVLTTPTPVSPPGGGGGGGPAPPQPIPFYDIKWTENFTGRNYNNGQEVLLSWSTSLTRNASINAVDLEYSINGGSDWLTIARGVANSGAYSWTVPTGISTTQARLRVVATDLINPLASDVSGFFSIGLVDSDLVAISPNGGRFLIGSEIEFAWQSDGIERISNLQISRNRGQSWINLAQNINGNTFRWIIDNQPGFINWRVIGFDVNGVMKVSQAPLPFEVYEEMNAEIDVTSPRNGDIFVAGSSMDILWSSNGIVGNVRLEYFDGTWKDLILNLQNDGSHTWIFPNELILNNSRIRVSGFTSTGERIEGLSGFFSVRESDQVELLVVRPNGGEVFDIDSSEAIRFLANSEVTAVDIYLSRNGGVSYSLLVNNWPAGDDYIWKVNGPETNSARIRVETRVNGSVISDVSDASFVIRATDFIEDEKEVDDEQVADEAQSELIDASVSLRVADSGFSPIRSQNGFAVLNQALIRFDLRDSSAVADRVQIFAGSRSFEVELTNGLGVFSSIVDQGSYAFRFIDSESEEVETVIVNFELFSLGKISDDNGPIVDALVTVWNGSTIFNTSIFGYNNPMRTGQAGAVGWMLPSGNYRVYVVADGYGEFSRDFSVTNGILAPVINLSTLALNVESLNDDNFLPILGLISEIGNLIQNLQNNPVANLFADIAEPLAVATAISGAIVLASSFSLLPLLQYIFTFPLLFLTRRRRNAYGTVYNAISKVTIPLATIRVVSESGKIVKSLVTSPAGQFVLRLPIGRFKVQVVKDGFVFPTEYLRGEKVDDKYVDLYHGELIEVKEDQAIIGLNIPMDPVQSEKMGSKASLLKKRFLRTFQIVSAHVGLLLAFFVAIIQPSPFALVLAFVQLFFYGLTYISLRNTHPKGWGFVLDESTGKPIKNAVIRLFEPKFNKLIEAQITDSQGRYIIVAGANEYYLRASGNGYVEREVRPINFKGIKEPKPISEKVRLKKM
jgi:hypothetical protein